MKNQSIARAGLLVVLLLGTAAIGHGQTTRNPSELRSQLRERYDIVALQRGVALVPRESGSNIRIVQVVDGVVTVDGETVTGRQLQDRLGRDADLVLQVSYLDRNGQRELIAADAGTAAAAAAPSSTIPPSERAETFERTQVRRGDLVLFGRPVRIGRDERVQGDVVAIGGSADVNGEITGELTVIGGPANLGPEAVVRGDVTVVGGPLSRAAGSRVFGKVDEVGVNGGRLRHGWRLANLFGSFWSRVGSLVGTVLRIALVILVGLVVVALGHDQVERIAARSAASPVRAGLVGFLAEILFLPVLIVTVVVLAVSIIGIPLLLLVPFAVLLAAIVMLVGFVGLADQVGRRLTRRFGWAERGPYASVALGVVAIAGLTLVARLAALAGGFLVGAPLAALGYFVEYVAWTIGLGAIILAWLETQSRFGSRTNATPPPPAPAEV